MPARVVQAGGRFPGDTAVSALGDKEGDLIVARKPGPAATKPLCP